MRRSFDGLSAMVRNHLGENPTSGHWFVFINRCRTQIKLLAFEGDGYWVWSKRLEQGQFHTTGQGDKRRLEWTELKLILEGIDLRSIRRFKRYHQPISEVVAV